MHKHLKFLGLFATNASIFDEVRDQDGQYFLRDIWVHFFLILKLKMNCQSILWKLGKFSRSLIFLIVILKKKNNVHFFQITGNTSIAQILNSLSVLAYRKREPYCARIFYNFYTTLTVEIESFDPEQKPEDSRRAITVKEMESPQ